MDNKPIKSKRVCTKTRLYYFDILKDNKGQQYLSISEIPTEHHPGKKKRQRIFIHAENIEKFANAFNQSAALIIDGPK